MKVRRFALLVLTIATSAAWAQPVYRCGSSYSQVACPQGLVVDVADSRTEAQLVDARRVAADDRRLAAQMQHDRLAEQASRPPRVVVVNGRTTRAVPIDDTGRHSPKKTKAHVPTGSPELSDPIIVMRPAPKRRAGHA